MTAPNNKTVKTSRRSAAVAAPLVVPTRSSTFHAETKASEDPPLTVLRMLLQNLHVSIGKLHSVLADQLGTEIPGESPEDVARLEGEPLALYETRIQAAILAQAISRVDAMMNNFERLF